MPSQGLFISLFFPSFLTIQRKILLLVDKFDSLVLAWDREIGNECGNEGIKVGYLISKMNIQMWGID